VASRFLVFNRADDTHSKWERAGGGAMKWENIVLIQGGPEKILLERLYSFVVNSNFYEPPVLA